MKYRMHYMIFLALCISSCDGENSSCFDPSRCPHRKPAQEPKKEEPPKKHERRW